MEYTAKFPARTIPDDLFPDVLDVLEKIADGGYVAMARRSVSVALAVIKQRGPQKTATEVIVLAFSYAETHEQIATLGVSWEDIWQKRIRTNVAETALKKAGNELSYHQIEEPADYELAYCVDIMYRMAQGHLLEEGNEELRMRLPYCWKMQREYMRP